MLQAINHWLLLCMLHNVVIEASLCNTYDSATRTHLDTTSTTIVCMFDISDALKPYITAQLHLPRRPKFLRFVVACSATQNERSPFKRPYSLCSDPVIQHIYVCGLSVLDSEAESGHRLV
ncbi:hypothetical protein F5J12DRAFT_851395 [Pisolithus orientalis]|uniref:uncharacterized protein n=1 Tax=Pisolithus orientalis TaxID=936130 RepID=UPI0022252669|nr:uncharacterized protein F5J12DRAFT_851395 [Pisolithus orientalis]KAI5997696.1 hypothetical protein F5J12DRAFT_851395 [Pisolithus orientalis]